MAMGALGLRVATAAAVVLLVSSQYADIRGLIFVLPVLAAIAAVIVARSFVTRVVRLVRSPRTERSRLAVPLLLNAVAVVFVVVLPLSRVPIVGRVISDARPYILAGFGDWLMAEGYPHINGTHRGVDVAGRPGTPVLTAAAGRVTVATDTGFPCGIKVVIDHQPHRYRTLYCHLAELSVRAGDDVKRGQRIGVIGMTGQRAWPGYEHVHWELYGRSGLEDPVRRTVGCFDATNPDSAEHLVLTYPVEC